MNNSRNYAPARIMHKIVFACLTLIFCHVCLLTAADTKSPAAITAQVTGSGRAMILIPGLGCGGNVWDGTVAHFKDTYQCHVITLAGFAGQPAIGEPFMEQVRDALATGSSDLPGENAPSSPTKGLTAMR
ncbi:MAG: bioH [Chthoniobacteraceae bacterium]|nr:bioH [Chthoniobacteraceae bacterium]